MDFYEQALKYKEEIIEKVIKLIGYKSVLDKYEPENINAPFGINIREALDYMIGLGDEAGFVVKNVDNYAGHIEYGKGDELIGILTHLDVVPATGEWIFDPFTGTVLNNRLYGRGSVDDKGATIASFYALKILKDLDVQLNKKVRLIFGCDEESGSRCLAHYFKKEKKPDLGFSPDADFPLINGEKGIMNFEIKGQAYSDIINFKSGTRFNIVPDKASCKLNINLEREYLKYLKLNHYNGEVIGNKYYAYGTSVHAMHPDKGLNAIFILADFLRKYINDPFLTLLDKYFNFDSTGAKMGIDLNDENMHDLTVNVGIVDYEFNDFSIKFDYRVPTSEHMKAVEKKMEEIANEFGFKSSTLVSVPVHYVSTESKLVKNLMAAYQKHSQDFENKPIVIGGGTYAKEVENAVAFGPVFPGREDVVHQINEYILIDDLIKAVAIYAEAIYNLGTEK